MLDLIPAKQKELKEFTAKYGEKELGNVTVSQVRRRAGLTRVARARPRRRALSATARESRASLR